MDIAFPANYKTKSYKAAFIILSIFNLFIYIGASESYKNSSTSLIESNDHLNTKGKANNENIIDKTFSLDNYIKNFIEKSILTEGKAVLDSSDIIKSKEKLHFLAEEKFQKKGKILDEMNNLNITAHSLNSLLFMAQRAFPINYIVKNDSSNPLPLAIDTSSLSLIIPELSIKYPKNTNMTLTIYEDAKSCVVPIISMAIDGVYLDFDIGIKMAVFNDETSEFDEILDTVISSSIKMTVFTQDNKLNVFLMKIIVEDLNIKINTLDLDKEILTTKFTGFFSLIIDQTRKMVTEIDVLKMMNDFYGYNFSYLEVLMNIGSTILKIQ